VRKFIKYFSIMLFSFFLMALFVSNPVEANYDRNKNKVSVSVSLEEVKISVKYQRGFRLDSTYKWCEVNSAGTITSNCTSSKKFSDNYGWELDQRVASEADNNPQTKTYTISKDNDYVLSNISSNADKKYKIVVNVTYCAVRQGDVGSYTGCDYSENVEKTFGINGKANGGAIEVGNLTTYGTVIGDSLEEIEDEGLRNVVAKVSKIVNGTIMPIIWVLIGLFAGVKGAIVGVQIVKAADEPQVRQEKIGSLKWLVIGIAIAAGVAGVVQVLTGYFKNTFAGGN